MFGNLYGHIDYDIEGFHLTEKFLVAEDAETNTSEILLVAGPYPKDFEAKKAEWEAWMNEVIIESEK